MVVDGIEKARFALTQAEGAAALADALADTYAQRLAARGVFVALVAFIDIARQTRNQLPKTKANKTQLAAVKSALNALANRDWGPYQPLRDRIGAHRQPLDDSDGPLSWQAANQLFVQIDRPLVEVLREDMQTIFNDLAVLSGAPAFAPAKFSAELVGRVTAARPQAEQRDLSIASGSFSETIGSTLTPIQGGPIGERLREVSDAIDGWELYGELSHAVEESRTLLRAVTVGGVIETANVIELIFDVPAGRSAGNRFAPLVEMIPPAYPEAADLRNEYTLLDPRDVAWVRTLRNSIAAHIDLKTPLHELVRVIDGVDATRLTNLFHSTVNSLSRVDSRHGITVMSTLVRLRRRGIAGISRIDPAAYSENYEN